MVMAQAYRIIICPDNEPEGWNIYWRLNSYYQIRGNIHLHSNRKTPGITYFGTNEEIYTPNQIMRTSLNRAAVIINEIFCKSVSYPTKTWEELDAFHRESKIAAADHILMKIRVLMQDEDITELTPKVTQEAYQKYCKNKQSATILDTYRKLDHTRWRRFYTYYNWTYGPTRNDIDRQHPMLCPYEQLNAEQKRERDAAWELLGSIAAELNETI